MMKRCAVALLALMFAALAVPFAQAQNDSSPTLAAIQDRGRVVCGVSADQPGFSKANSLGEYSGLNVDLCRAVAAAVFGKADQTAFVAVTEATQFAALSSGEIDVLISNATWELGTNASIGNYAGISFFDGQGFLVWKRTGIRTALELDNVSICVTRDSNTEQQVEEFYTANQLRYKPVLFDDDQAAVNAYSEGTCTVLSASQSSLASLRVTQSQPDAHRLLGSLISKQPLGPMVRHNDSVWENVVRWSLNCMINAEELGITSDNVEGFARGNASGNSSSTDYLVGRTGDLGSQLSLDNAWCTNIVRSVGNYAESYERHVGADSALQLPRGVNKLWSNAGLIYAPPIR